MSDGPQESANEARIKRLERDVAELRKQMRDTTRRVHNIDVALRRIQALVAVVERRLAEARQTMNTTVASLLSKRK